MKEHHMKWNIYMAPKQNLENWCNQKSNKELWSPSTTSHQSNLMEKVIIELSRVFCPK
jgi:hypothetical protein